MSLFSKTSNTIRQKDMDHTGLSNNWQQYSPEHFTVCWQVVWHTAWTTHGFTWNL